MGLFFISKDRKENLIDRIKYLEHWIRFAKAELHFQKMLYLHRKHQRLRLLPPKKTEELGSNESATVSGDVEVLVGLVWFFFLNHS